MILLTVLLWFLAVGVAMYLAGAAVYAVILARLFGPLATNPVIICVIVLESLRWPDVVLNRLFP